MEFNWKTARKGHGRTTQDVALVCELNNDDDQFGL
jgi:hypothetical protein